MTFYDDHDLAAIAQFNRDVMAGKIEVDEEIKKEVDLFMKHGRSPIVDIDEYLAYMGETINKAPPLAIAKLIYAVATEDKEEAERLVGTPLLDIQKNAAQWVAEKEVAARRSAA